MYAVTTSRWTSNRNGKIGSFATYLSINTNTRPIAAEQAKMIQIAGLIHGIFCPPRSRNSKKPMIVNASEIEPKKSIRRNLLHDGLLTFRGKDLSSCSNFKATREMAKSISGHWRKNDLKHRQRRFYCFLQAF